jgi:CelD/BcsL family acetyltransferase involved in cellulose biosynthesis
MLHVSALLLDDRILASHWGYILGRRFYYLLPGYEAGEWARYGPGNILNECLLQWCFSNGIETFDFGIGDETYKSYWCDQDINLFDFNCALTLKGKAYLALLQSREALRRSGRVRQAVRQLRKWGRSPATPTDGGVS